MLVRPTKQELADAHGLYMTSQWSVRFADAVGAAAFTARLRTAMPAALAGIDVDRAIDYAAGVDGLPPADLLGFELADGSRALVRPSGTEPKAKCYFEVVVPRTEPQRARDRLARLRTALQQVAGTMPE